MHAVTYVARLLTLPSHVGPPCAHASWQGSRCSSICESSLLAVFFVCIAHEIERLSPACSYPSDHLRSDLVDSQTNQGLYYGMLQCNSTPLRHRPKVMLFMHWMQFIPMCEGVHDVGMLFVHASW